MLPPAIASDKKISMLPDALQKRAEAVKHITGKWELTDKDGGSKTVVEILEDGRILFQGHDYGPDYHLDLNDQGDLLRGDGWKVEHGHFEPDATTLVWTKKGQEDVEWTRDLSAAETKTGEMAMTAISPTAVMLGGDFNRRSIEDGKSARFRVKSVRNPSDAEAGLASPSGRVYHDSSKHEHQVRGPGTWSTKDLADKAVADSMSKLKDHLETFAGSPRGHEDRALTDERNRLFQGFIKNLCRGVLVDLWVPSDSQATDILNDKEVLHAIPTVLYMLPEGEGVWFFIDRSVHKFCSYKLKQREVDLHFDAMVECHPLVAVQGANAGQRTVEHTEVLTDEMAKRSVVLTMMTGGDMEQMYSVDRTRPGTLIMTVRTEIGSHQLVRCFNLTIEHYKLIRQHPELENIAVNKSNFKDPIVQNTSFLHHLYKAKHHPNHRKPKFAVGLHVEVSYDTTVMVETVFDAGTPNEHKGFIKLPQEGIFEDGQFCIGEIIDHDVEHDVYTIKFIKGPYWHDEGIVSIADDEQVFDEHTMFKMVDPAFLEVEVMENLISHPPYFILTASALQVAAFVYSAYTTPGAVTATEPIAGKPWMYFKLLGSTVSGYSANSDFPVCDDLRWELWRYFSYQFCHKGAEHIGKNLIFQLSLGIPLEMVEGSFRMFLIYNLGVAYGALNCAMVDVYSIVVGASGGVYCLGGMLLANLVLNWNEMKQGICNHWIILAFLATYVITDLITYIVSHSESSSYAAHWGGGMAGFGIGIVILRNDVEENCERYILKPVIGFITFFFLVYTLSWNFTHFPPEPSMFSWAGSEKSMPCCWQVTKCDGLDESDYDLFTCKSSDGRDYLKADGYSFPRYNNGGCKEFKAYARFMNNVTDDWPGIDE